MNRRMMIALVLSFSFFSLACGPQAGSEPGEGYFPTEEEVRADAQRLLQAYNDASYEGFSARWSRSMKGVIDAQAFASFQRAQLQKSGRFLELMELVPASSRRSDLSAFVAKSRFEQERVDVTLGYLKNGGGIDAVVFRSAGAQ